MKLRRVLYKRMGRIFGSFYGHTEGKVVRNSETPGWVKPWHRAIPQIAFMLVAVLVLRQRQTKELESLD